MVSETGNATIPVREGEALDWPRLDAHLKAAIPGLHGRPRISQYPAGNSNLTYRLRYPDHDLVVRRPPFGTKARSAHSMHREYRVMNALRPVYPFVPETLHYSDDDTVIGAEFFVMRRVPGRVIRPTGQADWSLGPAQTRRMCVAFWDKLIELHQVDFAAAGLADFGRPEGYARRQVEGWNRRFRDAATPDVERFEDVQEWLSAKVPQDAAHPAVLHGDFRMDNVILATRDPCRITAVLDWEISALGDPMMDLGNALAYWVEPGDPEFLRGLNLQPSTASGMLNRAEILQLYARKTGRLIDDFTFYYTYGMFRNTVIIQQIYYRFYHGQTRDSRFASFGRLANDLGNHCRYIMREQAGLE
jgi:aminoglycoside phosphotransferase (APT) family kinase protein